MPSLLPTHDERPLGLVRPRLRLHLAPVIVPGEGPLNVFLADQGVTRVDDVPVIDSLGTLLQLAEVRAATYRRSGLVSARSGFYYAQPPAEAIRATRDFYRGRDAR